MFSSRAGDYCHIYIIQVVLILVMEKQACVKHTVTTGSRTHLMLLKRVRYSYFKSFYFLCQHSSQVTITWEKKYVREIKIIHIHTIPIHANIHNECYLKACREPLSRISVFWSIQWFSLCSSVIRILWLLLPTGLKKSLVFKHSSEKRSTFNSDYLSLSLQSANCTLIVLHKKTVKFITASSQWLFWYWLKGLIKSLERKTEGQISDSEVIREVVTCDDPTCVQFDSILGGKKRKKKKNYKAHFSSESFPILMFWIGRSSRREQKVTGLPHHLSALLHSVWFTG